MVSSRPPWATQGDAIPKETKKWAQDISQETRLILVEEGRETSGTSAVSQKFQGSRWPSSQA